MTILRIIGGVYITSAVWCMLRLDVSAQALGFGFLQPAAQIEYFSVYGGLQLGLGVAMLAVSMQSQLILGGVFFSWVFSSVLAVCRLVALVLFDGNGMMLGLLLLEMAIAAGLYWAWFRLNQSGR